MLDTILSVLSALQHGSPEPVTHGHLGVCIHHSGKPSNLYSEWNLECGLRAVDPNAGRCLVENNPEVCNVQFCHCIIARSNIRKQDSTDDIWYVI